MNMPPKIRTFIALDLPTNVVSMLGDVQRDLKAMRLRAKWVRPENIHLTLKFLGDIDSDELPNICAALSDVGQGFVPFRLAVRGIGFFPGVKRPRVIWVGLGGQIQLLLDLQRKLADNLASIGFPKEKRPFKGHLTLGRIKNAINSDVIRRIILDYADLHSDEFICGHISLYKSDLKPSGAVYSQLHRVDLKMSNDE